MHLIVATDYSPIASNACRYAMLMAKELKAKITFFHVYKNPSINVNTDSDFTSIREHIQVSETIKLNNYRMEIINSLGLNADEIESNGKVSAGKTTDEITSAAKWLHADLIITGTHGAKGLKNFIVGDHAWNIIQHSSVPVLIVPRNSIFSGINNIVFGLEGNSGEMPVIDFLINFSKKVKASIFALHVKNKTSQNDLEFENFQHTLSEIIHKSSFKKFELTLRDNGKVIDELKKISIDKKADCICLSNNQSFRIENISPKLFRKTKKLSMQTRIPLLLVPASFSTSPKNYWELSGLESLSK